MAVRRGSLQSHVTTSILGLVWEPDGTWEREVKAFRSSGLQGLWQLWQLWQPALVPNGLRRQGSQEKRLSILQDFG